VKYLFLVDMRLHGPENDEDHGLVVKGLIENALSGVESTSPVVTRIEDVGLVELVAENDRLKKRIADLAALITEDQ
jgi:hypothetical protein